MDKSVKKICLTASSPITIRAFLTNHIKLLGSSFEVTLIANFNKEMPSEPIVGAARIFDFPIRRKINIFMDIFALVSLIIHFINNRYALVHSVTPKAGLLTMVAAKLAGVPIRIHTFTGQVWVTRKGLTRLILKWLDYLLALMASHVLVDSPSQRQFLVDEGVVSAQKSTVLGQGSISGVDSQRFKPDQLIRDTIRSELGFDAASVVFLYLGRLNPEKGLLDLAKAFAYLANIRANARLVIVGPDEDEIHTQIKSICHRFLERIQFIGFTSNPEKFMIGADVFCLPSYREGFGSVVIESACTAIPTIGSNIYGITDALEDGLTGMLFEVGNVEMLVEKMKLMIDDSVTRTRMGIMARERAVRLFSSHAISGALVRYYEAILDKTSEKVIDSKGY